MIDKQGRTLNIGDKVHLEGCTTQPVVAQLHDTLSDEGHIGFFSQDDLDNGFYPWYYTSGSYVMKEIEN